MEMLLKNVNIGLDNHCGAYDIKAPDVATNSELQLHGGLASLCVAIDLICQFRGAVSWNLLYTDKQHNDRTAMLCIAIDWKRWISF